MRSINVHITNDCNFDCEVCFENKDLDNPTYIDTNKLMLFIAAYKPNHVGFVGGEPLLHPDLPDILIELRVMGIHTCVVTNGELLNKANPIYPNNISIGIDNDDQVEVDKWLANNKTVKNIEITITPTDITKIDALIEKYKAYTINISLLAFWDKKLAVLKYITLEYIAKMKDLHKKNPSIKFFGDIDNIDNFYGEAKSDRKSCCIAPLNIYPDGHLEYCDLCNAPLGQSIFTYDKDSLEKVWVEKPQCDSCSLRKLR